MGYILECSICLEYAQIGVQHFIYGSRKLDSNYKGALNFYLIWVNPETNVTAQCKHSEDKCLNLYFNVPPQLKHGIGSP